MQTCLQLTRHVLTTHLRLWPCYWFSCLLSAGDAWTSSHLCPVCLRMLSAFTVRCLLACGGVCLNSHPRPYVCTQGALGNADIGLGQKQRQQTPYPVQFVLSLCCLMRLATVTCRANRRYKLLLQMFYRWKAFKQVQWIAERLMAVTG